MLITRDMKIRDVLAINEEKIIGSLILLSPAFERLRYPKLRRAMGGRVTVSQAARIARIPLSEMLYVLNLAAGAGEETLSDEIFAECGWDDFAYSDSNLPIRPPEISGVQDTDTNVHFVDLMPQAEAHIEPMPAIAKGLVGLKNRTDILLLKHPFDPIPLRDLFAKRGYESWAEERKQGIWYIYFYRPRAAAAAKARPSVDHAVYAKAFAAAA